MAKNQIPTLKIERESVRIKIEIMELILHTPVTGGNGKLGHPTYSSARGQGRESKEKASEEQETAPSASWNLQLRIPRS